MILKNIDKWNREIEEKKNVLLNGRDKWKRQVYKPWQRLGRILLGRYTRASLVPRGSIAVPGPWPMGTARWCPPEKRGDSSIRFECRRKATPGNHVQERRSGRGGKRRDEREASTTTRFTEVQKDRKRKRAEAARPRRDASSFPFQFHVLVLRRANSSEFLSSSNAVSKCFDRRRRDALGPLSIYISTTVYIVTYTMPFQCIMFCERFWETFEAIVYDSCSPEQ